MGGEGKRRAVQRIASVEARSAIRQAPARATRTDLAKLAKMTQSEVSKFETREDHRIERMREMVEALGGKLEVIAVLGDKRVRVA